MDVKADKVKGKRKEKEKDKGGMHNRLGSDDMRRSGDMLRAIADLSTTTTTNEKDEKKEAWQLATEIKFLREQLAMRDHGMLH